MEGDPLNIHKITPKPRKERNASREELLKLDKNDLVTRILQLEEHVQNLKNIIIKKTDPNYKPDKERKRKFDYEKCHYRKILLRIMYFGWDYHGLVVQEDNTQTVEHHLFNALTKSCLIKDRESSAYHRCGRTDKGVSSFGQTFSIRVRSNIPPEQQYDSATNSSEVPYCRILNRLFPKEIRAVTWMPVPEDQPNLSARFDCKKRSYKYYFPRGDLDIRAMREACALLIGDHDFRHLCKMDVNNGVVEFRRRVIAADVVKVAPSEDGPMDMYSLVIEGNAFLWHQIRCIMGVLFLVGQRREKPEVITELLDIENHPRRPQYQMALDVPLNLFKCHYDLGKLQWYYDADSLKDLLRHLQKEWTIHNIKSTMIRDTLEQVENEFNKLRASGTEDVSEGDRVNEYTECLIQGVKSRKYIPLWEREQCSTLQERIQCVIKKRKTVDSSET